MLSIKIPFAIESFLHTFETLYILLIHIQSRAPQFVVREQNQKKREEKEIAKILLEIVIIKKPTTKEYQVLEHFGVKTTCDLHFLLPLFLLCC